MVELLVSLDRMKTLVHDLLVIEVSASRGPPAAQAPVPLATGVSSEPHCLAPCSLQTWKQHVLPHLKRHLVQKVDTSLTYLVLYHECSLANLLEVR